MCPPEPPNVLVLTPAVETTWTQKVGLATEECGEWLGRVLQSVALPARAVPARVQVEKVPREVASDHCVPIATSMSAARALAQAHLERKTKEEASALRAVVLVLDALPAVGKEAAQDSLLVADEAEAHGETRPLWVLWTVLGDCAAARQLEPTEVWTAMLRAVACAIWTKALCSKPTCVFGPMPGAMSVAVAPVHGVCPECRRKHAGEGAEIEVIASLARLTGSIHPGGRLGIAPPVTFEELRATGVRRLRTLCEDPFETCVRVDDELLVQHAAVAAGEDVADVGRAAAARTGALLEGAPDWLKTFSTAREKVDALSRLSPKRHRDHCRHVAYVALLGDLFWTARTAENAVGSTSLASWTRAAAGMEEVEANGPGRDYVVVALAHDLCHPLATLLRPLSAVGAPELCGTAEPMEGQIAALSELIVDWLCEGHDADEPAGAAFVQFLSEWRKVIAEPGELRKLAEGKANELAEWLAVDKAGMTEVLAGLGEEADHGLLSALLARHVLSNCETPYPEDALRRLIGAIALHEAGPKRIRTALDMAADDPLSIKDQPLLWMLLLCDELHTWGRPVLTRSSLEAELDCIRVHGVQWPLGCPVGFCGDRLEIELPYTDPARLKRTGWEEGKIAKSLTEVLSFLSHPDNPRPLDDIKWRLVTPWRAGHSG
jgi:hypothetical protein